MFDISLLRYYWHDVFEKERTFAGHRHFDYEINILLQGEIVLTCENSVYHLYAGDYAILPSFNFHHYRSVGSPPCEFASLSFIAPNMQAGIAPVFSTFTPVQKEICDAFLADARQQGYGNGSCRGILPRTQHLLEVLFEYLFTPNVRTVHASDPSSGIYHAACTYMQNHINENITLHDLARTCLTSISTLKNIFPRFAGMSCIQFFNEMKLDKAKRMLELGMTCTQTSDALSFSSPAYFSRKFKAFHGVSPSEIQRIPT